jgi:hypothetical protein
MSKTMMPPAMRNEEMLMAKKPSSDEEGYRHQRIHDREQRREEHPECGSVEMRSPDVVEDIAGQVHDRLAGAGHRQ